MASDKDLPQAMSSTRCSKTWASGRTLTEAQRDRKRKADRAGHRERRQKAQSRILQLETRLESVTREPATEKMLHLMGEVERLEAENRTMLRCLESKISSAEAPDEANALLSLEGSDIIAYPEISAPKVAFDDPKSLSRTASSLPKMLEGVEYVALPNCSRNGPGRYHFESPTSDYGFGLETTISVQKNSSNKSQLAVENVKKNLLEPVSGIHEAENALGTLSIVRRANLILAEAHCLSKKEVCMDDLANQNFLILAIVEGWEAAETRLTFCPLWTLLREIDGLIFWATPPVERMVMLRMIHSMLICMVKSQTFDELPTWYRPRPAQQHFRHEASMGYFAWPSLRERLVLSKEVILTNEFWDAFGRFFRFYWPYDARATFEKDKWTGNYRFSGSFENSIREIRMWRMDIEFFSRFPLLIDDIFLQESIPKAICPPQDMPYVSTELGGSNYGFLEDTLPEECSGEEFAMFEPFFLPDPCGTPFLHLTNCILR